MNLFVILFINTQQSRQVSESMGRSSKFYSKSYSSGAKIFYPIHVINRKEQLVQGTEDKCPHKKDAIGLFWNFQLPEEIGKYLFQVFYIT